MSKRIFIFITLCKLIENNAPKSKISGDSFPRLVITKEELHKFIGICSESKNFVAHFQRLPKKRPFFATMSLKLSRFWISSIDVLYACDSVGQRGKTLKLIYALKWLHFSSYWRHKVQLLTQILHLFVIFPFISCRSLVTIEEFTQEFDDIFVTACRHSTWDILFTLSVTKLHRFLRNVYLCSISFVFNVI